MSYLIPQQKKETFFDKYLTTNSERKGLIEVKDPRRLQNQFENELKNSLKANQNKRGRIPLIKIQVSQRTKYEQDSSSEKEEEKVPVIPKQKLNVKETDIKDILLNAKAKPSAPKNVPAYNMSFGGDNDTLNDDFDSLGFDLENKDSKEVPLKKSHTKVPDNFKMGGSKLSLIEDLEDDHLNDAYPPQASLIKTQSESVSKDKFGAPKNLMEKIKSSESEKEKVKNEEKDKPSEQIFGEKKERNQDNALNPIIKKHPIKKDSANPAAGFLGSSSGKLPTGTIDKSNPMKNPLKEARAKKEAEEKKKKEEENKKKEELKPKETEAQITKPVPQKPGGFFSQPSSNTPSFLSSSKPQVKLTGGVFANKPGGIFGNTASKPSTSMNPTLGGGTFGQSSLSQALSSNKAGSKQDVFGQTNRTFGSKNEDSGTGMSGFKSITSSAQPNTNSFLASGGNDNDMDEEDIFGSGQPSQPNQPSFGFNNSSAFNSSSGSAFGQPSTGLGQPKPSIFGQTSGTMGSSLGFNPQSNPSFTQRRK